MRCWSLRGEGVQLGRDAGRLSRADPPEDLFCLPQARLGISGAAGGQGAAAQAGQRLGLIPGAIDHAGQVPCLPVTGRCLVEVTAEPVQRPRLIERLSLTAPVAEVTVDAQGRLQGLGCARVVPGQPPRYPQETEGVALA